MKNHKDGLSTLRISSLANSIENLKERYKDLSSTLYINKGLLNITMQNFCNDIPIDSKKSITNLVKQFNNLEDKCKETFNKNISLHEQIIELHDKIEIKQLNVDDKTIDLIAKSKALSSLLVDKESKIEDMKSELIDSQYKESSSYIKKCRMRPTSRTVDVHNELMFGKSAFKKLNVQLKEENIKYEKLLKKNNQVKQKNEKLKDFLKRILSNPESFYIQFIPER